MGQRDGGRDESGRGAALDVATPPRCVQALLFAPSYLLGWIFYFASCVVCMYVMCSAKKISLQRGQIRKFCVAQRAMYS